MVHKINGERVRSNFVCQILNPCSRVIFIVIWSSLRRVWPLPRMRAIRSCLVSPCQRERSKSKWICWTPAELEKGRASMKYFDSEISRDFSDFQSKLKKRNTNDLLSAGQMREKARYVWFGYSSLISLKKWYHAFFVKRKKQKLNEN